MNETNSTCEDAHPFLFNFGAFLKDYYRLFLIIFGTIGNSITILIFWRTKLTHSSRTSFYLISLAISDMVFIILLLFQYLDTYELLPIYLSIKGRTNLCKGSIYIGYITNFVSCGLVLAFTVQRLCSICFPLRVNKYNMESRSKIVLIVLIAFGFILYSYTLRIYDSVFDVKTNTSYCWVRSEFADNAEVFNFVDSLVTLVLPFLGLLIMNAMIIRTLKNSNYNFVVRTSATSINKSRLNKNKYSNKNAQLKNKSKFNFDTHNNVNNEQVNLKEGHIRKQSNDVPLSMIKSSSLNQIDYSLKSK